MKLITLTICKNRMGKDAMFEQWMENVYSYSDLMIILDNNSDDGTQEYIETYPDPDNKIILIPRVELDFATNESEIRAMLWESCRQKAEEGDWILVLDTDEFIEDKFIQEKKKIIDFLESKKYELMMFKFCDMWSADKYRIDGLWSPFFPRLFKFKNVPWGSTPQGLHRSNLPQYVNGLKSFTSIYRIKHYSYHTEEIRKQKSDYYLARSTGINLEHAKTILKNERLREFRENPFDKSILICAPVRNREWILPFYLRGILNLDYDKKHLYYYFTVNNTTDKSAEVIKKWAVDNKLADRVIVEEIEFKDAFQQRERDWNGTILQNMAWMRTRMLEKMIELRTDYLFSVDSDILLHPDVLNHLILSDKEIISPVFWAKWDSQKREGKGFPQVWINGGYHVTPEFLNFLANNKSRVQVGGLGACTLIAREVAEKGVTYYRVHNLPNDMRGEDRDFCVRAVCAGFDLWATTFIPLKHVDRPEDLKEHLDYIESHDWWKNV